MIRELTFGKKKIGKGHPVLIVAELSANHFQNYELAKKMIKSAADAGADAIKLQTYTPDTITIKSDREEFKVKGTGLWDGKYLYDLYEESYTPWEWQPKLKKYAESFGMELFSAPFDLSAVDFLEKMDVPAYKISSFEITDIPLIEKIAKKHKTIFVSSGIADVKEIEEFFKVCKKCGNDKIILLKCSSAYPSKPEDLNLMTITDMKKRFKTLVGLSDHTLGTTVASVAVALGACVVEKHLILKRDMGGHDAAFSLEPAEFSEMVKLVRETEKMLGKPSYELSAKAKNNRRFTRSLYVVEDVKKDDVFTDKSIKSIRPNRGLSTKYYYKILGKKAAKDIKKGTPLEMDMVAK